MRSRMLTGVAAVVALLICYPLSYHQVAAKYQSNPTVQTIYQPLMWVEEQMLTSHGDVAVPGT